jgi:hypothetical protein
MAELNSNTTTTMNENGLGFQPLLIVCLNYLAFVTTNFLPYVNLFVAALTLLPAILNGFTNIITAFKKLRSTFRHVNDAEENEENETK